MAFIFFCLTAFIVVFSSRSRDSTTSSASGLEQSFRGFNLHSFNAFNGKLIPNYSGKSFNLQPRWDVSNTYNIATLNKKNQIEYPTDLTDRNNLVLTTDSLHNAFWLPRNAPPFNDSTVHIPLNEIGLLHAQSQRLDDRIKGTLYPESTYGMLRYNKYFDDYITLYEYERMSGIIAIKCDRNSVSSMVTIKICNALPKSVYTVWEIGAINVLTQLEDTIFNATPLPNILITDKLGYGTIEFELNYCVLSEFKCNGVINSKCIQYALAYHPDYSVYAGNGGFELYSPYALGDGNILMTKYQFYIGDVPLLNGDTYGLNGVNNPKKWFNKQCH